MEYFTNCFTRCDNCDNINLVPESWGGKLVDYYVYTNISDESVSISLYSTGNAEIFINGVSTGKYATTEGTIVENIPSGAVIKVKNQNINSSTMQFLVNCEEKYGGCLELTKVNRYGTLHFAFEKSNAIGSVNDDAFSETKETDFKHIFAECKYLKKFISSFSKIKQATDISYMFFGCESLEEVPYLDLPNVENADHAFCSCTKLKKIGYTINMPSLSISTSMFEGCSELTEIPFSFDTLSSLTCATLMFKGCSKLVRTPNSWEGLGNASLVSRMFADCTSLMTIPTSWKGLKATQLIGMFAGCTSLSTIPKNWTGLEQVTSIESIFDGCIELDYVPSSWDGLNNISNMDYAFRGCLELSSGGTDDLYSLSNVTTCIEAFKDNAKRDNVLDLFSQLYGKCKATGTNCFEGCEKDIDKITLDWGGTLDISTLTEYKIVNSNLSAKLTLYSGKKFSVYVNEVYYGEYDSDNPSVIDNLYNGDRVQTKGQIARQSSSFENTYIVKEAGTFDLEITRIDNELARNIEGAFSFTWNIKYFDFSLLNGCTSVKGIFAHSHIKNAKIVNSTITNFYRAFYQSRIETVEAINISKAENCEAMFSGCSQLTRIPKLMSIGTESNTDISMREMFYNCYNLTEIGGIDNNIFKNKIDKQLKVDANSMFNACEKLYKGISKNTKEYFLYEIIAYFEKACNYLTIDEAKDLVYYCVCGCGGETTEQRRESTVDELQNLTITVMNIETGNEEQVSLNFLDLG